MCAGQNDYGNGFLIDTDKLIANANNYDDIAYNQARNYLVNISSSIDVLNTNGNENASDLRTIYDTIMSNHEKCRQLCEAAVSIANIYETAEDSIMGLDKPEMAEIAVDTLTTTAAVTGTDDASDDADSNDEDTGEDDENEVEVSGDYYTKHTEETTTKDGDSTTEYKTTVGFSNDSATAVKQKGSSNYIYDSDNKTLVDTSTEEGEELEKSNSFNKKVGTLGEYSVGVSAEYTLMGIKKDYKSKYVNAGGELYVARAEASASAAVGAYVYKTADGEYENGVGLSTQAGASFTAEGGDGSVGVGNAMIGASGSVDAKIDTVDTTASAQVGIVDGKPNIVLSGDAEADVVKASATGSKTILGVTTSVTGTVKVGVGAEAEVGLEDGKFKCDFGVSLGVGFDVSFSIDFSKVKDAAITVAHGIETAAKAVGQAIETVGEGIETAAETVGNGIKSAAEAVGHGISSFFHKLF